MKEIKPTIFQTLAVKTLLNSLTVFTIDLESVVDEFLFYVQANHHEFKMSTSALQNV